MPSGAASRRHRRGDRPTSSSGKCVKTCVTDADLALPARSSLERRRLLRSAVVVLSGQPCRARHFGHAAEQALRGPRAHQQFVAARDARRPRRGAARPPSSAPCAETSPRSPRAAAPRNHRSAGTAHRPASSACRSMEPRSISACALSPARDGPSNVDASSLDARLRLRQRLLDRIQPRHHALDIAVDRHGPGCRRRSPPIAAAVYGADARQLAQAFLGVGKHPAVVAQHRHRAGMQVARARIIAEPGPHPQHVILRGAAERRDVRPARQELLEIRPDRFRRRSAAA